MKKEFSKPWDSQYMLNELGQADYPLYVQVLYYHLYQLLNYLQYDGVTLIEFLNVYHVTTSLVIMLQNTGITIPQEIIEFLSDIGYGFMKGE